MQIMLSNVQVSYSSMQKSEKVKVIVANVQLKFLFSFTIWKDFYLCEKGYNNARLTRLLVGLLRLRVYCGHFQQCKHLWSFVGGPKHGKVSKKSGTHVFQQLYFFHI